MRYTTIIDITEQPEIYRNQKIRLLYLHLVLKSGFHDDDRDVCRKSIRSLAMETGLTVSSVRHALRQLKAFGLLKVQGDALVVTKFVLETPISKRARTKKEQSDQEMASARNRQQRQLEQQYARMDQDTHDREFIEAYEKYQKALQDGSIGMAGQMFLQRNKSRYESLKSKS